jgi:membrane-bound ClpP family serine protease
MAQVVMGRFGRYLLFQVPGWVLVGLGLIVLWPESWGSGTALAVFAAWIAKDLALYPIVGRAYDRRVPTGVAGLIGTRKIVADGIASEGWLIIDGTRWRATLAAGAAPIPPGETAEVVGADGLTLLVRPANSGARP